MTDRYAGMTRLPARGPGPATLRCPCGQVLTTAGGVAGVHAEHCYDLRLEREGRCMWRSRQGWRCALVVHPLPGDSNGGQMHFVDLMRELGR